MDYPKNSEELEIVNKYTQKITIPQLTKVFTAQDLKNLQTLARQVPIADDIKRKVVELIHKTRTKKELIEYGASPRASIGLILAAKARALLNGNPFVSMDDIKAMAYPVLRHRIVLSFEAERQQKTPDDVIRELLN